ncbi:helix-turn-helix domain-containing protein [Bacillus sp. FJAT-50079]|uniref:helix-turn-helix transcriptional regulator n=1 Tax=Bacillus sp. FJAT-50079 TaxID=2833577 RepID=UPI001BC97EE4|nr:helix-turn-helix domain-containing protein [Bacillus sp. FJAT-50079]MBS4208759.1 helix-turn-helix domain-containing protein [Bacillus sp. FJAT-50079]
MSKGCGFLSQLQSYIPLIDFIGRFLGTDAEIILYDMKTKKAVYVKHSFTDETKVGMDLPSIERKFIKEQVFNETDSLLNYRALSSERKKLRSATHFIKNEEGELMGVLTINLKVDELIELRDIINRLISGSEKTAQTDQYIFENFELSFEDMMNNTIQEALTKFNLPPDRLSHHEKMELIRMLDEKGTFLIKGSVTELAKILNTTETTVYRYINKL